jgi:hypothetical protein
MDTNKRKKNGARYLIHNYYETEPENHDPYDIADEPDPAGASQPERSPEGYAERADNKA